MRYALRRGVLTGNVLAELPIAKTLQDYVETVLPNEWSAKFSSATSFAYNLQYMFRENIKKAQGMFEDNVRKDTTPQSARRMYERLVASALEAYGDDGIVSQVRHLCMRLMCVPSPNDTARHTPYRPSCRKVTSSRNQKNCSRSWTPPLRA